MALRQYPKASESGCLGCISTPGSNTDWDSIHGISLDSSIPSSDGRLMLPRLTQWQQSLVCPRSLLNSRNLCRGRGGRQAPPGDTPPILSLSDHHLPRLSASGSGQGPDEKNLGSLQRVLLQRGPPRSQCLHPGFPLRPHHAAALHVPFGQPVPDLSTQLPRSAQLCFLRQLAYCIRR